jgi:hypothetical protein
LSSAENITAMKALLSKIAFADQAGLHIFGLGEHHRKEFLDESKPVGVARHL